MINININVFCILNFIKLFICIIFKYENIFKMKRKL